MNLPHWMSGHFTRKSRQSTNWPPADDRRRGSQGILLSICETELEQMTDHSSEQHQKSNGNLRFQVGLQPTKMYKRALSSTYSSLPTPSQLFGVFHSTIQGSGNVPLRFRCLESCLTALCSWDTRASTSQVTSLLLGGHTVKLSAAFGCRETTESIAHHHHVAIFGYNFVATLRNTATCSRCSTRRAIHEVSAPSDKCEILIVRGKNFLETGCVLLPWGPEKTNASGITCSRARCAWRLSKPFLLRGSLASTLRAPFRAVGCASMCVD